VWLVAAVPVGVILAIVVSFWPSAARKDARPPRPRDEPPPSATAAALPPPEVVPADPRPPPSAPAPSAPPAAPSPVASAPAAPPEDAGPRPEKIPELAAFSSRLPPDADEWTPEQKQAYRDRLFQRLEERERALEREVAFAESRQDEEALATKRATLAYLRAEKAKLDRKAP